MLINTQTLINNNLNNLYNFKKEQNMRLAAKLIVIGIMLLTLAACRENPNNKFGGPSNNPHDTADSRRDTSSAGLRTDARE